jgi:preprotein translocase subunit Sec63
MCKRVQQEMDRALSNLQENYYITMGIQMSATEQELRKAYKLLALRYHPGESVLSAHLLHEYAVLTYTI